uniref:Putative triabin n=1 Tax=Panstrongylus lignarius TaxID=156445 RepID=A0A224XZV7_9HEMI
MKIIIAVIIFGILTLASSATNKCSKDKAMDGFDPAKFFNGTWYVVEEMNATSPVVCQVLKTEGVEGFSYLVESGYNYNNEQEKYECNGKKGEKKDQFVYRCKSNKNGCENKNFDVDFAVLDTDYEDYGLVSRCRFASGTTKDDILVIQRTKPDGFADDAEKICHNSK